MRDGSIRGGTVVLLLAAAATVGAGSSGFAGPSGTPHGLGLGLRTERRTPNAERRTPNAQRLGTGPKEEQASFRTEHFEVVYRPGRLGRERAEEAGRAAESGWSRCEKLFGAVVTGRTQLDLTPDFFGATGFAQPVDPRDRTGVPLIGVRYAELEYLGLSSDYVLTHELAHVFSGPVAGTALGEGVADWGAGTFSGIPMRPWWGAALRKGGLWIDPDGFFVTGDFPATPEVDAVIRTAQYVESGLLVQYLVDRFGWARTRAFAVEYGRARGPLESNDDRMRRPARQRGGQARRPALPPAASQVRSLFERHFGERWEELRSDWERRMERDSAPERQADRLVLAQRIYGAVRNYEMWVLDQRESPTRGEHAAVREAFTRANQALSRGDVAAASQAYDRARELVERLRRPQIMALAPVPPAAASAKTR